MFISGVSNFSDWAAGIPAAPTAAQVSIGGRIINQTGRGVANAQIMMLDQNGEPRYARTNPFGYYRFVEVAAGETYIINVSHKRFTFAPRVLTVSEELENLDFTAQP